MAALRLLGALTFLALAGGPARAVRAEYSVRVPAGADRVKVSAALTDLPKGPVTVAMPVWFPGYYARTDQAAGITGLRVTSNGAPLATERLSPSLWRVEDHPGAIRVEYHAEAREYGFHAAYPAPTLGHLGLHVDATSAYIHPGAALVYLLGHEDAPSTLRLNLPHGWQSAAPLPRNASGAYTAPDYHTLNDSPVQAGAFRRLEFAARGRPFEVIVVGQPNIAEAAITEVCRRIGEAGLDLFEGHAPFARYQFHLHFPPDRERSGAGLEHGAASVMVFDKGMDEKRFRARGARLIAHEFLHAWNIKALRPEGFLPLDYQNPPRTMSLWFVEGATDYLAHLVLARSGLWTPEQMMAGFAEQANAYRASWGRNRTSLATASEGVWDAGAGSNGFGGTDYYTKGFLAAWLLDAEVRAATKGEKGLEDAVRHMVRAYAKSGQPYPPDALPEAIQAACGVDVWDTYRAAVYGTDDLPLEEAAERMGLRWRTVRGPFLDAKHPPTLILEPADDPTPAQQAVRARILAAASRRPSAG